MKLFPLIYLFIPILLPALASSPPICFSYDNITDTCTINNSIMFNTSASYNVTNLIITNSYLNCSITSLFNKCSFKVNATTIRILNSSLYFSIIEFNGTDLTLSNSNLSTNGTIKNGLGRPNECSTFSNDVGIGYAGSGAFCQDLNPNCGRPYGALNLLLNQTNDADNALGSGSGQLISDFYGCGGGRVYIYMENLVFDGSNILSASGSPQQEPEYDCTRRDSKELDILNGGTGGYIYIGIRNNLTLNNITTDTIKVIAEGGNYCDTFDGKSTKFAGSGGRIYIDVEPTILRNLAFFLKGGINDASVKLQNVNPCRNGASGSLYFYRNNSVVFNNDGYKANTITQIPNNISFNSILISNGARGGPSDFSDGLINSTNIVINQAYLAYERFFTQLNLFIINELVVLGDLDGGSGGIGPPEQNSKSTSLNINAYSVNFSNNTMIQFGKEFNLSCTTATFYGSIQSYFFDSGIYISTGTLKIQEAVIEVATMAISVLSNLLIMNSRLKAFKQKCKNENSTYHSYTNLLDYQLNLSNLSQKSTIIETLHSLIQTNYTLFILTPKNLSFSIEDSTDSSKNIIQSANLGLFAQNINVSANFFVSSEDLGCGNEQGIGKGTQDPNLGNKCGGTGGSYGGFGSLAWSNYTDILKDCLKIKSPSIYGDMFNPLYEGSGGGGNQQRLNPGGKGGGVIIIAAQKNLTINGIVTSSGSFPETQMGKATAGSGSGGSIQLFMEFLVGSGMVMSEGGSTQASGIGGPGGGGRIRVNFLKWYEGGFYSENWNGSFSVSQGKRSDFIIIPDDANENIGKGSISTTPCMPGHYGEVCGLCENGKYKNIAGTSSCFVCLNKPENAYYSLNGDVKSQCSFRCNETITNNNIEDNPNCYAPFYFYINKMGGYPGIIGIALTLTIILFIVLIRFVKKKKKFFKDSVDRTHYLFEDMNMEKGVLKKELSKVVFCMEDMPYHLKRIYLVGENSMETPWCINKNDCLDITHHEIDIIKNSDFLQVVNERLKFNSFVKFLLILIRWIYYPLYYLLIYFVRHRKNKMMMEFLPELKILYRNQESFNSDEPLIPLFLKFSSTLDLTLGYIDILNYNKSVLEWSSMKFPICLILAGEGSFLFPLYLSQYDPLVKTLAMIINEEGQIMEKEIWDVEKLEINENEDGEKLQKNRKTNFQDFLKGFNESARRIDYWSSFSDFMNNVIDLLEYVDRNNNEYFKQKNMRAEIFLHQISDSQQTKENRQQTTIMFLDKDSKNELERFLKEAQIVKHYDHSFDIKFSLNLIKNEDMSDRNSSFVRNEVNFDYIVKRPLTIEDKKVENNDDDMDNLKKQLMSRLEENSPEIQKARREVVVLHKWDFLKEEWPQNFRTWFDSFERCLGYFRAFFLRFRSSKENSSLLPVGLFFLLIVDFLVLLIHIAITVGDKFTNNAGLVYFYPFSIIISTVLFVIWFGCFQNNILLGKLFLIYNAQSMFNMLVGFGVALSSDSQKSWEILVYLLFMLEKFIILYVGSKYLGLK